MGFVLVGGRGGELLSVFSTSEEVGGWGSGCEEQQRGRRFDSWPFPLPPSAS